MKLDKVEQAMNEACERVREALQDADASKTPVGCTVAVFAGKTAIVGASGAIDCAALGSKPAPDPVRFELEPGESVEVVPCSMGEQADGNAR